MDDHQCYSNNRQQQYKMSMMRGRSLYILQQFIRKRLLPDDDDMIIMEKETKIMLKVANELTDRMNAFVLCGVSSWENAESYAVNVCKCVIEDTTTCNWGRIVAACTYAVESVRRQQRQPDIEEIARWLYDDILNTSSWMENHTWNEFVRHFGEEEKKKKNNLFYTMFIYIPCISIIVYSLLFK